MAFFRHTGARPAGQQSSLDWQLPPASFQHLSCTGAEYSAAGPLTLSASFRAQATKM